MTLHRPNSIPLKLRAFAAAFAGFLLLFAVAASMAGYTYLPGKRGGMLLSGLPTLLVVFSAICACSAAILTIIDHYDKRPNEATYESVKRTAWKVALVALVSAPLLELAEALLRLAGVDIFPQFHGLASQYTLYSPHLSSYASYVTPILDRGLYIAAVSALLCGSGVLVDKYFPGKARTFVMATIGAGLLGFSTLFLASSTKSFLDGEVKTGSWRHKVIVKAEAEPAKFNAVLLTHFALGGAMLFGSMALIVAAASTKR